jgi:hypothetical protein
VAGFLVFGRPPFSMGGWVRRGERMDAILARV